LRRRARALILAFVAGTMAEVNRDRVQTFSTRAAARILAVSPDRIRYWVRRRLLNPAVQRGRKYRFAFDDLLMMRMAKELLPGRSRLGRVQRYFDKARNLLERERPLTALKFHNEDGRIVIRDGDSLFEIDSGQMLLRFAPKAAGKIDDRLAAVRARTRFEEIKRVAESDSSRAMALCQELLRCEPANFELLLQMAALQERQGDLNEALRHLQGAAAILPERIEVHLKLGLLYRRMGSLEEATASFTRALGCDPASLEAHRNLAELYERMGRKRDALRHLSALKRLSHDA
jgi:tetratricopeptide (TPR) repeat protein